MAPHFSKKKTMLATCLAILCAFAIYQFIELKIPDCADAQTCIPVIPRVAYWVAGVGWPAGQSCVTFATSSPAMGVSSGAVALAGWELTNDVNDDQWMLGAVEILDPVSVGGSISFSVRACLADDGPNKAGSPWIKFVAFGWP